ncbi:anthranilate synthase component I family protein [Pedobacter sp. MC2016-24]|uniref:anthranilate synthase component I family protein n=1 Tax=Pedobacter sp. MC2016-24 TaxID=2780090 RepID=UPI00351C5CD9
MIHTFFVGASLLRISYICATNMNGQQLNYFKQKALTWATSFEVCCCLDSNNYADLYGKFDFIIAAGVKAELNASSKDKFTELKAFHDQQSDWMFGLLSYDLKNETEALSSEHPDHIQMPELFFFVPEYLIAITAGNIEVLRGADTVIDEIHQTVPLIADLKKDLNIQSRFSKEQYLETVVKLQQHISRGDIYEVNFCQEFFAEHAAIDPVQVYQKLSEVSPTPFSGFFKIRSQYILSASPERFLCKRGSRLISQPIKGTAKRSTNPLNDELIKEELRQDQKEQAENVMIVDLVRNDLTKSALRGSVTVDELFGIYSFPQVFQMISTISCELDPDIHFIDAIRNTFPMGSMTGAPKLKAMELIETYEKSKRGAYSGAFGYITPDEDFDFNVIIRSILYTAESRYLSFQVGGAITYAAEPIAEYEECLLKASAIVQTLTQ